MNFERCRFVAEMVGVASIVAVLRYQPRIAFTLCCAVCFDASHRVRLQTNGTDVAII